MREPGSDQKKMNVIDRKDKTTVTVNSRVVISVYAESTAKVSDPRTRPVRRIKLTQFPGRHRIGRTAGSNNRRAQLLGYARELRGGDRDLSPNRVSGPKQKRRWFSVPNKLHTLFNRIFRKTDKRWRYERFVSDKNAEDDGLCNSKCINSQSKEAGKIPFSRRFRCIYRVLSWGGQCRS